MKPKTVYHGTSAAAAADILKRGVRMEESSKGYFGMGFYTTEKQALAKSNYADFAEEDDDPGVVLAFSVSPRARLLDLRTSKDWDRYMALRWRGLSVTQFLHRDDFHTIMQSLGIDGLYDDSFDGWVFYNPKVLKLIKSNPLLPLPPDFFPRISKQRDQLKAIRDDIHKKTGVWYDDLDEVADLLRKAEVTHRRKQIRVVKKTNPIKKVKTMNRTKKNPTHRERWGKEYGIGDDPFSGFFILPDGLFLLGRAVGQDHRNIGFVAPPKQRDKFYTAHGGQSRLMLVIMRKHGLVRWIPEGWAAQLVVKPTAAQIRVLKRESTKNQGIRLIMHRVHSTSGEVYGNKFEQVLNDPYELEDAIESFWGVTKRSRKNNPEPHPLDPQYLGAFKSPAEVPPTTRDGDTVVVWREEYNRWEAWVYNSFDKLWDYGSQGTKAEMIRKAKEAVA